MSSFARDIRSALLFLNTARKQFPSITLKPRFLSVDIARSNRECKAEGTPVEGAVTAIKSPGTNFEGKRMFIH